RGDEERRGASFDVDEVDVEAAILRVGQGYRRRTQEHTDSRQCGPDGTHRGISEVGKQNRKLEIPMSKGIRNSKVKSDIMSIVGGMATTVDRSPHFRFWTFGFPSKLRLRRSSFQRRQR